MAFSDTHGDLNGIIPLYQNFHENSKDIFQNQNDKSTLNLMTVVGDWFMNPDQKGYLTDPSKTSGDYQAEFFNAFIKNAKSLIPNLKVLYTPGNHCLDGGAKTLVEHVQKLDLDCIISNANLSEESTLINEIPLENRKKFNEFKILEVQDDKDKSLIHKVLVLGISPININYLVKEDISGLNLFGTNNKKEADMTDDDTKITAEALNKIILEFKKNNQSSGVILMCHSGEPVSKAIANEVADIDLILNAHDHLDKISYVNNKFGTKTKIISLSQNGHKLEKVNLHFNDSGIKSVTTQSYYTDFEKPQQDNPLKIMYDRLFKKDLDPLVKIHDQKNRSELAIDDIRYQNNDLANFCTDTILSEIHKKNPEVNVFFMPSTAFRENLPTSNKRAVTNLDLISLLKGIAGDNSNVMIGKMTGKTLAGFLAENISDNLRSPSRNAIIQPSGLNINRTAISQKVAQGANLCRSDAELIYEFVKIQNSNGKYESISPNIEYTIALPQKLFVKSTNNEFKKEGRSFSNTQTMISEYFRNNILNSKSEIDLKIDNRIV